MVRIYKFMSLIMHLLLIYTEVTLHYNIKEALSACHSKSTSVYTTLSSQKSNLPCN